VEVPDVRRRVAHEGSFVTRAARSAATSPASSKGEPYATTSAGARPLVDVLGGRPPAADVANLDAMRAPHRATRAVVDAEGQAPVRELYAAFDAFNRAHFGGELRAPLILVTNTASPRALGDATERDVHGLQSLIRLHPRTLGRGSLFADDVLLHEMVHVWQAERVGDMELGYRGHGPRFAGRCTEIGARLGLSAVGVKGRKGLPNCAQWPLCVRPEGYYGDESAERERAKRAPKPKGDDVAGDSRGEDGDDADRGDELGDGPAPADVAAGVCDRFAERLEAKAARLPPSRARARQVRAAKLRRAAEIIRAIAGGRL
jgi:hypothetical protein